MIKFGVNLRKNLTGAELAVRIFQISALLPLTYLLLGSGYPRVFTQYGLFSVLFDLGLAALPRLETLGLSLLYRLSGSELTIYFLMLVVALAVGLLANSLLKGSGKRPFAVRAVWAGLIALDLAFRFVPLPFASLPVWARIFGFAVRLGCLALILLDLRAARRAQA